MLLFQAVNYEWRDADGWGGQLANLREFLSEHGFSVVHTGDWAQDLASSSIQPHADIEAAHNRF